MCNFEHAKLSNFMDSKQLISRALKKEFLSADEGQFFISGCVPVSQRPTPKAYQPQKSPYDDEKQRHNSRIQRDMIIVCFPKLAHQPRLSRQEELNTSNGQNRQGGQIDQGARYPEKNDHGFLYRRFHICPQYSFD